MSLLNRLIDITAARLRDKFEGIFSPKKQNEAKEAEQDFQFSPEMKINKRLILDLEIFDLQPPSSWQEVRKQRNVLMKKYHSDLYSKNAEKEKIAKEVTQIYNEAYERLKKHFGQN